ncbi:MAG: trypsin-like peptidase domain-containing protein [Proteobacteria bacterium]|nr:trypsin-like peptidase domain-containing protein [Pseudomonadota bacterium]
MITHLLFLKKILVLMCMLVIADKAYSESSSACTNDCKCVADAINESAKAVVNIYVLQINNQVFNPFLDDPSFGFFFGNMIPNQPRVIQGSGSGVILKKDGLLITCAHVVSDAEKIKVKLNDGREFEAKTVYLNKNLDIAFVKIEKDETEELPVATIGNSDDLLITEPIYAVGNAFGIGQSITGGIVSALNRVMDGKVMFQIDAAVNPGNSGGAIFNKKGEYVATPSAIATKTGANHGVGFAIPSSLIKAYLQKIEEKRTEDMIWMGVTLQELSYDIAKTFKDFDLKSYQGGVMITKIHDLSPLVEKIKKEDVILSVDGILVSKVEVFDYLVNLKTLGKPLTLKVWRHEKGVFDITINTVQIPDSEKTKSILIEGNHALSGYLIAEVTEELLQKEDIDPALKGKIVIVGRDGKPLVQNDIFGISLKIGDEIVKINDKIIKSTDDVKNALQKGFKSIIVKRNGSVISFAQR